VYQQHLHQHHNRNAAAMPQNNDRWFNSGPPAQMIDPAGGVGQDHTMRNYRGGVSNNPPMPQQVVVGSNLRHQENHYCAMPHMNNTGGGCCCPPPGGSNPGGVGAGGPLPDILNSHRVDVPPPYEPPAPSRLHAVQFNTAAVDGGGVPNQSWANNASPAQLVTTATLTRAHVPLVARLSGGVDYKHCFSQQCCLRCVIAMTTFRWMLASFAVLGIGCIVAGLVLGAMQMASGSGYLLHSLLFMGKCEENWSFYVTLKLFVCLHNNI